MFMQRKACVIDVYSYGSYHEVINQGFLMMISQLYSEVVYIAEKSSIENQKRLLDSCNVDYSNVSFIEKKICFPKFRSAGLSYLFRLVIVSCLNYYYYIKTSKDEDVFFNNNLFFALALISFFSCWKKNRVYSMCHNEMEMIDEKKRDTGAMKIWGSFLKIMFTRSSVNQKINLLLLSPRMENYFKQFVHPKNCNRIGWIDHCYIRPENNRIDGILQAGGLKIGIPGAITLNRGLPQLKKILNGIRGSQLKLFATSFVSGIQDSENFECLNKKGRLLPFAEYNSFIQQMDVLVLFYEAGSYKLTASGAILEAIWNQKPIFALRNNYFEYLFERFGQLGELFDCEEDLVKALISIKQTDIEKYYPALRLAKDALNPNCVKQQLQNVLERS